MLLHIWKPEIKLKQLKCFLIVLNLLRHDYYTDRYENVYYMTHPQTRTTFALNALILTTMLVQE